MEAADSGIACPAKNELLDEAGFDQLVVNEIRRQPCRRQVSNALTNDLMSGRETNQMREAFDLK